MNLRIVDLDYTSNTDGRVDYSFDHGSTLRYWHSGILDLNQLPKYLLNIMSD